MQKSQGDFWSYQVVLEIQMKKRSGPMIIASIEVATVTEHDVRGWKGAYVPININLFIIHPDHYKVVPHHPWGLRLVRDL